MRLIEIVGKVIKLNNGDECIVLENVGIKCKVKFLNSGNEKWVYKSHLMAGKVKDNLPHIITYDNYSEIILYNKNRDIVAKCKIDICDIDLIKNMAWNLTSHGYVRNSKVGYLHKILTGFDITDHINGDKTDNRRFNLREANMFLNNHNIIKNENNHTSKYNGVFYVKKTKKFHSNLNSRHLCLHEKDYLCHVVYYKTKIALNPELKDWLNCEYEYDSLNEEEKLFVNNTIDKIRKKEWYNDIIQNRGLS